MKHMSRASIVLPQCVGALDSRLRGNDGGGRDGEQARPFNESLLEIIRKMLNDPKIIVEIEIDILIYQHFSQNSVDNDISTDFAKQSMVFVDQFNKEMSRKNNFLLLRLHQKHGTTRYSGKNIIPHNAYFLGKQLISLSVLAKIMEFYHSSPGYPQILWTRRFINGPYFAHLRICRFFIF